MERELRAICVYGGSAGGHDPGLAAAAERLGHAIAMRGLALVYGGGSRGIMGAVARGCRGAGGAVTGIIPEFLLPKERPDETAGDDVVVVAGMHARKQLMFDRADAFVALPGGVGTLEELVEQLTWAQLGRHGKPIVVADVGGFWRPFLDLLAHMRMAGFIPSDRDAPLLVAEKIDDVIPMIEAAIRRLGGRPTAPLPPL